MSSYRGKETLYQHDSGKHGQRWSNDSKAWVIIRPSREINVILVTLRQACTLILGLSTMHTEQSFTCLFCNLTCTLDYEMLVIFSYQQEWTFSASNDFGSIRLMILYIWCEHTITLLAVISDIGWLLWNKWWILYRLAHISMFYM